MSEPARRGARSTIDRERLADWSRSLFKGTAYLTLFLLDIFVVQTIWNDFDGISPGGWFGIFWLAVANTIMLPKVTRTVFGAIGAVLVIGVFIGVFILLWFIPTNWLPPYAGLIIVGVLLVYALFTRLDAINANLVRANELKERESSKSSGSRSDCPRRDESDDRLRPR
jgi:hypothetical protein